MLIYVIPDVQIRLDSIEDSRMSSKKLWRCIDETSPLVHQAEWKIAHNFLTVYLYLNSHLP